jgi:hypothetical protein
MHKGWTVEARYHAYSSFVHNIFFWILVRGKRMFYNMLGWWWLGAYSLPYQMQFLPFCNSLLCSVILVSQRCASLLLTGDMRNCWVLPCTQHHWSYLGPWASWSARCLIVSHLPNGPTAYLGLLNVVSVTICCISNADLDITIWITSSANIIRFCCAGDSAWY